MAGSSKLMKPKRDLVVVQTAKPIGQKNLKLLQENGLLCLPVQLIECMKIETCMEQHLQPTIEKLEQLKVRDVDSMNFITYGQSTTAGVYGRKDSGQQAFEKMMANDSALGRRNLMSYLRERESHFQRHSGLYKDQKLKDDLTEVEICDLSLNYSMSTTTPYVYNLGKNNIVVPALHSNPNLSSMETTCNRLNYLSENWENPVSGVRVPLDPEKPQQLHSIQGVTYGQITVGVGGSITAFHQEDFSFESVLYLSKWSKGCKIWLTPQPWHIRKFLQCLHTDVRKDLGDQDELCRAFLQCKSYVATRAWLNEKGIDHQIVVQRPGEYVFTRPHVPHLVINTGITLAVTCNFIGQYAKEAPERWRVPICDCIGVSHGNKFKVDMDAVFAKYEKNHPQVKFESKICPNCSKLIQKNLKQHVTAFCKAIRKIEECPFCYKTCENSTRLRMHVQKHHADDKCYMWKTLGTVWLPQQEAEPMIHEGEELQIRKHCLISSFLQHLSYYYFRLPEFRQELKELEDQALALKVIKAMKLIGMRKFTEAYFTWLTEVMGLKPTIKVDALGKRYWNATPQNVGSVLPVAAKFLGIYQTVKLGNPCTSCCEYKTITCSTISVALQEKPNDFAKQYLKRCAFPCGGEIPGYGGNHTKVVTKSPAVMAFNIAPGRSFEDLSEIADPDLALVHNGYNYKLTGYGVTYQNTVGTGYHASTVHCVENAKLNACDGHGFRLYEDLAKTGPARAGGNKKWFHASMVWYVRQDLLPRIKIEDSAALGDMILKRTAEQVEEASAAKRGRMSPNLLFDSWDQYFEQIAGV